MYKTDLLSINDLFNIHLVNLDEKTETFTLPYYIYHIISNTEDNLKISNNHDDSIIAYIFGKHGRYSGEINNGDYYGHVTALSVAPQYRRQGHAANLMKYLEYNSISNSAIFIDLFARKSNIPAVKFYRNLGFSTFNVIENYYLNPVEDCYDMRKQIKNKNTEKSEMYK